MASDQLKKLTLKIDAMVKDLIDDDTMKRAARQSLDIIQKRTIRGVGLNKTKTETETFKPLKNKDHIRKRISAAKTGKLSSKTSPKTSNLTFTGNLINNLKIDKIGDKEYSISPARKDEKRAEGLEKQGRRFIGLSDKESDSVVDKILNDVVANLNRIFKN